MFSIPVIVALVVAGLIGLLSLGVPLTLRRVVPTNEVHIVQTKKMAQSYGKDLPGGNVYYNWPSWFPVVGVEVSKFPLSNIKIDLKDYEAYDRDRVPFVVDIMGFFCVDDPEVAAKRVSNWNELVTQLTAITQSSVRSVLASEDIDQIMVNRGIFGEKFISEIREDLKSWGIIPVKNLELIDIRDSHGSNVIEAIQAKRVSDIERDSREVVAENTRRAQTAEIAAQRDVDLQKQEATQQVGQRAAQTKREVGIAEELQAQAVAVERKETRTRELAVQEVEEIRAAEIRKQVQVVAAEEQKQTSIIQAEAKRQTDIVRAEGQKQQEILVADGKLESEKRNAEGIQAVGAAQAEAEKAKGLALIAPQMELAKEIGDNVGYQKYLIDNRTVEANERIGIEQAQALKGADVKVIANGSSAGDGLASVGQLFSAKGGTQIGSMLEGFVNTDAGKAVLEKLGVKL